MNYDFIQKAIDLAYNNVLDKLASPYGAVVVKDGKIIGMGTNDVQLTNDPTAHAEIQAIREACQHLKSTDLSDCEIYTSGDPCAMCVATIYQTRAKIIYYAYARDPEKGQRSNYVYKQICISAEKRDIPSIQVENKNPDRNPNDLWDKLRIS